LHEAANKQTNRESDRQTDRQTDNQTDRQIDKRRVLNNLLGEVTNNNIALILKLGFKTLIVLAI